MGSTWTAFATSYSCGKFSFYQITEAIEVTRFFFQVPSQTHPHAAATAAVAMLSSAYEAVSSDMSPLKRKKLSSLLMQRDTPILRTVLGQGQVESSQPVSLVCHPDSAEMPASEDRIVKVSIIVHFMFF